MATARDGKMFSSRQAMLAHERKLPPPGGAPGKKADVLKMPGQGGGGADDGEQGGGEDPAAVVAEHGPAHEVHITHEAGTHHVHSVHGDGHEHHSEHASVDEAHEHGKQLAEDGGGEEQPGEDDELGGLDGAEFE